MRAFSSNDAALISHQHRYCILEYEERTKHAVQQSQRFDRFCSDRLPVAPVVSAKADDRRIARIPASTLQPSTFNLQPFNPESLQDWPDFFSLPFILFPD